MKGRVGAAVGGIHFGPPFPLNASARVASASMFDAISIRPSGDPLAGPLDLGLFTEAMLFYGNVDVVMTRVFFRAIIAALGAETLVELADTEGVALAFCNQFVGVLTEDMGTPAERHFMGFIEHTNEGALVKTEVTYEELSTRLFSDVVSSKQKASRLAARFMTRVPEVRLDYSIHHEATLDALDASYTTVLAEVALSAIAPRYKPPSPLVFRCHRIDVPGGFVDRLVVETNIDWQAANHFRLQGTPELNAATVLGPILSTIEDLACAVRAGAELATSPVVAAMVRRKSEQVAARSERSSMQRGDFQEWLFSEAHAVREAVNAGARSFQDAMRLAASGRKFRHWLAEKPPDAELLQEYYRATVSGTWAETLKMKTLRWLLVTGGGATAGATIHPPLGAIMGPVLGTADFLQDAFRRDWKPNQFVERKVRPFVEVK